MLRNPSCSYSVLFVSFICKTVGLCWAWCHLSDVAVCAADHFVLPVHWYCWFGYVACKNDLLCVGWDVKPYSRLSVQCSSELAVSEHSRTARHWCGSHAYIGIVRGWDCCYCGCRPIICRRVVWNKPAWRTVRHKDTSFCSAAGNNIWCGLYWTRF